MKTLKFLYAVIILVIVPSACMPTPTTVAPSVTAKVATSTPTVTLTPVPTSTFTPVPTDTLTLTPTITPTPTETPVPTIDMMALFAQAGVEFPMDTTSYFKADYGEFNFRISKGLSDKIGKPYIQLPRHLLEEIYLHTMGKFMLYARRVDPTRYANFYDLAEMIRQDEISGGKRRYDDWPEFRQLSKAVLEDGTAPFNIKPPLSEQTWNLKGDIVYVKNLSFNLLDEGEFINLTGVFEDENVNYFLSDTGYSDLLMQTALLLNGSDVEIFYYDKGFKDDSSVTPNSDNLRYFGSPLEKLTPGLENFWYFSGIVSSYRWLLMSTLRTLMNPEDAQFFDPVNNQYWTEQDYDRFRPDDAMWAFGLYEGKAKVEEDKFLKPIFTP